MTWTLPTSVQDGETTLRIRNRCDYRIVFEVIAVLSDDELIPSDRAEWALIIFYENYEEIKNAQFAYDEMMRIINAGEEYQDGQETNSRLFDWEHDFTIIAPPVSRVLGYSVRDEKNYTHYYDFIGAFMELGECLFSTVVSIRQKRQKGKKLENWEREFYREHRQMVDLPQKLTSEEEEWLNSEW